MKISIIGIIVSLWGIKFASEEFLLNFMPKGTWFVLGIIGLIYFSHRLGKKQFSLKKYLLK